MTDVANPSLKNNLKSTTISNNAPKLDSAPPLLTLTDVGFAIHTHTATRIKGTSGWLAGARSTPPKTHASSATQTKDKVLLTNINMTIQPHEKISIIGPNGAGKSTLIKLILGLLTPTSGHIVRHETLKIGYVPQKFNIPAILPLRVQDLLTQVENGLSTTQQIQLYERLSIAPLLKQQVLHLSGGETQRVLLARSLLNKPNLLILDEPMQGLDPESERWLYEFIDDLPDFLRCAMVVVSHDLHWVMRGSRHVICLNKHICCEGQPNELGVTQEFKALFGHQFEQPYIHKPHACQHTITPDSIA